MPFAKFLTMIESLFTSQSSITGETKRVLTYVKNERMGGYVPKYEIIKNTQSNVSQNIEDSLAGAQGLDTLAYQNTNKALSDDEQFGFADLIDMVNPLHHIPVVGHVYRELTGDEIKPISKIMGGAAFSGPLGVTTALIDTVIEEETGKSMTANAFDMAFSSDANNSPPNHKKIQKPEQAIENAISIANDYEMTAALLAYSDLGNKSDEILKYEATKRVEDIMEKAPAPREPITRVSFSEKGGLYAL